ncbi:hypothetical protein OG250_35390 [Streptomyces sp. NBC_00487]|uniref:hypothetical protein n=1 Tax=unclassified Streptomyces TaxID=2593676 RepID=UPI002E18936D|nr:MULTISPECIES: hypothetical protein [unclassified Streptomyces]
MCSPALDAALADIDHVFAGFASPTETGCDRCFSPEAVALLRVPHVPLPRDELHTFVHKVRDHYEDHDAVMRRLLPQTARAMADGGFDIGSGRHGLSRTDWRTWPAEQAAAIEAFLYAWWEAMLLTPEPPYSLDDVLATCAGIGGSATVFLDRWPIHPVADTHLVNRSRAWARDLLVDDSPLHWYDHVPDNGVRELGAWLVRSAHARLVALGESALAARVALIALPYDERWSPRNVDTALGID